MQYQLLSYKWGVLLSTKVELLAGLRLRLNDISAVRWQDPELNAYLVDAARDYSKYFPLRKEQEFDTVVGTQRYDVPSDLIDDYILQIDIINTNSPQVEQIPQIQLKRNRSNRYYEVVGSTLIFGFVPLVAQSVIVRYNAIHQMPDSGETTIPFDDEDLIYTYCMAAAWQRIGGNDAGLSRWTEGEKRDDSPLIPHYTLLWSKYTRLIDQKQSVPRFYKLVRATSNWRS